MGTDQAIQQDDSQRAVVSAPTEAHLVVEAGPGYGKTEVACTRVAELLRRGVRAGAILLLSFTRTAVREMRARIRILSENHPGAGQVEIRTLDSLVWRLVKNYRGELPAGPGSPWDRSIREARKLLAEPPGDLVEYLEGFQHVFVDESQDLEGDRAELVVTLLTQTLTHCGWTVFIDPAQAIYGWAGDVGSLGASTRRFVDLVKDLGPNVQRMALSTLHRARKQDNPGLVETFVAARRAVLEPGIPDRLGTIRSLLQAQAKGTTQHEEMTAFVQSLRRMSDNTLILFRTRAELLWVAGYLASQHLPFRLRLSSLPPVIAPWIAVVCNRAQKPELLTGDFGNIWGSLQGSWLTRGWDAAHAWETLLHLGRKGTNRVSVSGVADHLSSLALPDELSLKEVGPGGPILSTIHASKGREAMLAVVCLPAAFASDDDDDGDDEQDGHEERDEEARVLYVALTRAKGALFIRSGMRPRFRTSRDGRVWTRTQKGDLKVEIGRPFDLDPLGAMLAPAAGPEASQLSLEQFDGTIRSLEIRSHQVESVWHKDLFLKLADGSRGEAVGRLDPHCDRDLLDVARAAWGKQAHSPTHIGHLSWVDVTTVATRADDPRLFDLPRAWRKSRLWLAPVVAGLGFAHQPR